VQLARALTGATATQWSVKPHLPRVFQRIGYTQQGAMLRYHRTTAVNAHTHYKTRNTRPWGFRITGISRNEMLPIMRLICTDNTQDKRFVNYDKQMLR